jgi:hypothetical protein
VGIVNYKKIGIFLGIAFVLYFLVQQPEESAGLVRDALGGVGDAAGKLAEFVRSLVR